MAIQPVEIKDTILKNFTPSLDFACQENDGGIQSAGHTTGQKIIDGVTDSITATALSNSIYISESSGSDTNGTGSILYPFASISKAIDYAKLNGISINNRFTGYILGSKIDDSAGQIILPPYFNLKGETARTTIDNSLPIIADLVSFTAGSDAQTCIENLFITGEINIDLSTMPPSFGGYFFNIKNVEINGDFSLRGAPGYIITVYTYDCLYNSAFNTDYTSISFSIGNSYFNMNLGTNTLPGANNYGFFQSDQAYNVVARNGTYSFVSSPVYFTIDIDNPNTILAANAVSLYANPTISVTNSATLRYLDNPIYFKPVPATKITANSFTFDFSTDVFILIQTGAGIYTMPLANGNSGRRITIKKGNGVVNPVTLNTQPSESFFTNVIINSINDMAQGTSLSFISDGISLWYLI